MNSKQLELERKQLLNKVRAIENKLGITKTRLDLDEIKDKVEKFTGINVKKIGKYGDMDTKIAKQMFWRTGYLYKYSGTILSRYCGMKTRFSATKGKNMYIDKCSKNKILQQDWESFKQKL